MSRKVKDISNFNKKDKKNIRSGMKRLEKRLRKKGIITEKE